MLYLWKGKIIRNITSEEKEFLEVYVIAENFDDADKNLMKLDDFQIGEFEIISIEKICVCIDIKKEMNISNIFFIKE